MYNLWYSHFGENTPEIVHVLKTLMTENYENEQIKSVCSFAVATLPEDFGMYLVEPY